MLGRCVWKPVLPILIAVFNIFPRMSYYNLLKIEFKVHLLVLAIYSLTYSHVFRMILLFSYYNEVGDDLEWSLSSGVRHVNKSTNALYITCLGPRLIFDSVTQSFPAFHQ